MTTFAVLATGPSMSQVIADYVRGKCSVVAVSDAYKLAPWADVLVSNDWAWWEHHRDALAFAGQKFCSSPRGGMKRIPSDAYLGSGLNSGLQGMRIAELLGATRILMLGFDMHGTHFFGKHPAPLRNTSPQRFNAHVAQFDKWRTRAEIINCTPGSAIRRYPFMPIGEALCSIGTGAGSKVALSA